MSEKDAETLLPQVTKDDIITAELNAMLDPENYEILEWLLKTENKLLLGEIKRRSYAAVHEANDRSSVELLALFMNNALFSIRALRAALLRQSQEKAGQTPGLESTRDILPNDGADDADPQPST